MLNSQATIDEAKTHTRRQNNGLAIALKYKVKFYCNLCGFPQKKRYSLLNSNHSLETIPGNWRIVNSDWLLQRKLTLTFHVNRQNHKNHLIEIFISWIFYFIPGKATHKRTHNQLPRNQMHRWQERELMNLKRRKVALRISFDLNVINFLSIEWKFIACKIYGEFDNTWTQRLNSDGAPRTRFDWLIDWIARVLGGQLVILEACIFGNWCHLQIISRMGLFTMRSIYFAFVSILNRLTVTCRRTKMPELIDIYVPIATMNISTSHTSNDKCIS